MNGGSVSVTKIPLDAVVWDPQVYPRQRWNTDTIKRYADAMRAGDVFPPLVLEENTNRLLDGKHRFEAYKVVETKEVAVEYAKIPADVPLKLFAASLSARHGDRLANSDLRDICRGIFTSNPQYSQEQVGRLLGVSQQRVSEYAGDILALYREDRKYKAVRLSMLGWTQRDIADRLGITHPTVGSALEDFAESGKIFQSGLSVEEVARRLGAPVQLVMAQQLKDATDQKRMDALGIKIQPYDAWHFQSCHDLMGDKHPGRVPGEIVCHILYFYTQAGDLVVDPMAGSGTTLDACLLMGRRARGYDIDERHSRIDIQKHDLADGWPAITSKAKLIFWDPPYFDKKDDGYVDGSISGYGRDQYLSFMERSIKDAFKVAMPGAYFMFLMSDWDDGNETDGIFIWDYATILKRAGWNLVRQIQVPLTTQQVHPDIVNKFRESRKLARLGRSLMVAKK